MERWRSFWLASGAAVFTLAGTGNAPGTRSPRLMGSVLRTPSDARGSGTAAKRTLIGYVALPRGGGVCLAGTWAPGEGWRQPPRTRTAPAAFRCSAWDLFRGPDRAPVRIRTKPQPFAEEAGQCFGYDVVRSSSGGLAVARGGRLLRRPARRVIRQTAELKRDTLQLLRRHGIRGVRQARPTDAWRVDLDGDGEAEVLWTARSRESWTIPYTDPKLPGHGRPGDYALLALRWSHAGRDYAAALQVASVASACPCYRILTPVDVDRDRRLEVFAHAEYFEEDELLAFAFDGRRVRGLLGTTLPAAGSTNPGDG